MSRWLTTLHRRDDYWFSSEEDEAQKRLAAERKEYDRHAVDRWRETRSPHWLIAAMCCNGLRSTELQDVYDASAQVAENSAAYLTANYFVIDALIASNKNAQARERINKVLTRKDLPPSARRVFWEMQSSLGPRLTPRIRKWRRCSIT